MKELKKWIVLIAALFVLTGMMSCELLNPGDDLAIEGSWDAGYDSSLVIKGSTFSSMYKGKLSYSAEIVSFDNNGFNASEKGKGDCGYMVIKYTSTPSWFDADSLTGKYMILRWQNLQTVNNVTTMEYSEGSNDTNWGDTTPGTLFDSASEAIEGATAASGFFAFSSVTKITE